MIVLGIESSCDEMAAAVVDDAGVRSSVVHSQVDIHALYGGVVPEIASRDHVKMVGRIIRQALTDAELALSGIDGIAVTRGPGLIGSLLCGLEAAKGLAVATKLPLIGINHLEGHVAAAMLEAPAPEPPFIALVVSGGHTSLVDVRALGGPYETIGQTRDDAAGEAFDKTAKLLGLGYPGGMRIDQLSEGRDAKRFPFPDAMPGKDNFDFSFSGLKTAALRLIQQHGPFEDEALGDFCASFQSAVVENLLKKGFNACRARGRDQLVLVGGVAANRRLRARAEERAKGRGVRVFLPSRANCTDNAAMIARAGLERLKRGETSPLDLSATPHWPLDET